MGLTIHYQLEAKVRTPDKARELVQRLRQRAVDLPFKEVSNIADYRADEANLDHVARDHPHRWLLIQAEGSLEQGEQYFRIPPERVIAFSTQPGEGCEPANFGLCSYPAFIQFAENGRTRKLRTGLTDWSWSSFCKTEFASNPSFGGVEHFLRCHLAVVRMLDFAKDMGILHGVTDESDYFEKRDLVVLSKGRWQTMKPGWSDRLKDMFGDEVAAQLEKSPIFEQSNHNNRSAKSA